MMTMMQNLLVFRALAAILCCKTNALKNAEDERNSARWRETVLKRRAAGDVSDGDTDLSPLEPQYTSLHLEEVEFRVRLVDGAWRWNCCVEDGPQCGEEGPLWASGSGASQEEALLAAIADAEEQLAKDKAA